jgi:hypothetical protein
MDPISVLDITTINDEQPDLEILRLHLLVMRELESFFQLLFTKAFFGP